MPAYYLHVDDGDDSEFEAPSDSAALRIAAEKIKAEYEPEDTTYWAHATLLDEHGELVNDWYEEIVPQAPDCDPPLTDLGWASAEELERIWGAAVNEEDGHMWARPFQLVGGWRANPGILGHGGGMIIREVCLRCGTLRVTDTWATDPATGEEGLRSVEYEPGRYDREVEDAWYSADEPAEFEFADY